jgi:SNF2 family DNA or RNA helicase
MYSNGQPNAAGAVGEGVGEVFDLNTANITAEDTMYLDRDSEKHMRELLSGAIGEGEDDGEEAMDTVHGLAEGVTLMPHQQRGVRWLKKREAAKNFGGILADVSPSCRDLYRHG